MDQKLQGLEELSIQQATVSPHWQSSGDAFWKGLRQAAFDHVGLATELRKYTQRDISSTNLPFSWINVAQDGAWTRFQFNERSWQYLKSGKLEPWNGEFDEGSLDSGCKEIPSPHTTQKSSITFQNHTSQLITFSWIDNAGKPRYYGKIAAGQSTTQSSYIGHIWRLAVEASKKSIACAVKDEPAVAEIEELDQNLVLRWDVHTTAEDSECTENTKILGSGPEAFIRDFNVWVRNIDGTERQMSYDGFVDNKFKEDRIYPSSDGRNVVVWQCKPESKHLIHMVESSPKNQLQPNLSSTQYLKPGDNVEVQRPRLFDLVAHQEILVDDTLFRNPYALTSIGWSRDGNRYRFIFNERGHQQLRLIEISSNGTVSILAEESSRTFVDYAHKMYYKILESTDELLWASERDGWNHLYLFDLRSGSLKNQITKGNWVLRSVESVDEENRIIWFRGLGMVPGQDPYYAHLARVNFDGTDLSIITEGDGTHTWKWSLDKRFLIDTWSRVDLPPRTVVRDAQTGEKIVNLEQAPLNLLLKAGWACPERFLALGRDGQTGIYGIIIRPTNFNATRKYPILEQVYAGPQDYYTPKSFQSFPNLRNRADQGYIMVLLDGMGTNWRSKAFHDVCYKNLKDAGFPDRIAWIRAAAQTRPWMDLSHVGCYGGSAGGQNAVAGVLHHGDFYKAACASAGCHDNRMDKLWWNELWMGYPVDESYWESSNVTHAWRLNGALMLVVGELDTNVDPSSTMQLVNALIEADKDFDLVFIPGGDHQVSALPYVMKKQDRFFRRYLQDC